MAHGLAGVTVGVGRIQAVGIDPLRRSGCAGLRLPRAQAIGARTSEAVITIVERPTMCVAQTYPPLFEWSRRPDRM